MGWTSPFYTKNEENPKVYHNQSECEYGKEIKRYHDEVYGEGIGRRLCDKCKQLS